jgi:hypothetical protein
MDILLMCFLKRKKIDLDVRKRKAESAGLFRRFRFPGHRQNQCAASHIRSIGGTLSAGLPGRLKSSTVYISVDSVL